jgi:acyl dehydratase
MRSLIGLETEPVTYDIEPGAIRKFARAIGDASPIYVDEVAARAAGYRGIVAPPTFLRLLIPGPEKRPFPEPFQRVLDGGSTYRLDEPLVAGDRVMVVSKLADVFEKQGRLGVMLFKLREISYRNQAGSVAAVQRSTIITY